MRLRVLMVLALLATLFAVPALSEAVQYGETVYVYEAEAAQPAAAYVTVQGIAYDADTLAPTTMPGMRGAVFGVYARDAAGNHVPYPDPDDPLKPYRVTTTTEATLIKLPGTVDLYLRQEAAPEGYAVDAEQPVYRRLAAGDVLTYTNHQQGHQGLVLTLTGSGAGGDIPLSGVLFSLEGMGESHTAATDALGSAIFAGVAPGGYVLTQLSTAEGYQVDAPRVEVDIPSDAPVRIALSNSQDGGLSLRTLGLSMDAQGMARLVPIERRYAVYDESGNALGDIAAGETIALPASAGGTTYVLRAEEDPADGFASDPQAHMATVYPGQTAAVQTVVQDTRGAFDFLHVNAADGAPVAGGIFTLEDASGNEVLTFEADAQGRYTPLSPLPAGTYTLRMVHAATGHVYKDTALSVRIVSAFDAQPAAGTVTFVTDALPDSVFEPVVRADVQALPSLFDQDAAINFTLSAFTGEEPVTIENIVYEFTMPDVEGLTVQAHRPDGAYVRIARRVELEGVPEITGITIEGSISYTFTYRVDSEGGAQTLDVSSPFSVQVATFAKSTRATPYVVSGHIRDEAGAPVSGLQVTLGTMETVTDPFGAYAFGAHPEGAVPAFAVPQGYGARAEGFDYWILPLQSVSGSVIAEGGVDGYPVRISMGDESPVTPDADGNFTIAGPFTATDRLMVETPEGVLAALDESGENPVIRVYPAAALSGVALDPEDNPVAGVAVRLEGEGVADAVQTAEDGTFAFEGLHPGAYTLVLAVPEGYVINGPDRHELSLEAGQRQEDVRLDVMRAAAIEGSLLEDGSPYAGIRVMLEPANLQAVTDDAGSFAFEGLGLGTYTLVFQVPEDMILLDAPEAIALTRPAERVRQVVHAVQPAGLSGRIWYDANDDGYLSTDESGQPGVRVVLLDEQAAAVAQAQTDTNGFFSFDGLTPGAYRLAVTLPEGMIFAREAPDTERIAVGVDAASAESDWYMLASGQRLEGLVAGAIEAGAIHGILWEDLDGNGLLNGEEARMHGMEVVLWKDGAAYAAQKTDILGQYRFDSLRPGDYTLYITFPEGCMFTTQASGGSGTVASTVATQQANTASHAVSLRRWRMDAAVNAGMQRAVSISVHAWQDTAAGGANPGNAGYAGMAVSLLRMTGSTTETLAALAHTDAEGNVRFDNLRPGLYKLQYELPDADSWGFTAGATDIAGRYGYSEPYTLSSGRDHAFEDVGLTKYGRIEGTAFMDADYSGLRDAGEAGLSIEVALLTASGGVLREAYTRADGGYAFDRLPAGMYSVRFTLPSGYAFTRQRMDAPSFNSDVPEAEGLVAQTDAIYLPMGESLLLDAGAYRKASLSGAVWQDIGSRGRYSYGNPPLAGLSVTLLREGVEHALATTDADGAFRFADIPPGAYTVRVSLPDTMRFTAPSTGTRPSLVPLTDATEAETGTLAIGNGENRQAVDVGVVLLGTAAGVAIDSRTGNALPGVTVTINTGNASIRTSTDENGRYRYEGMRPGEASVVFEAPEGYALAEAYAQPVQVSIPQGGTVAADVACIPEATIQGSLWLDAGADGTPEGDAPAEDIAVTLYKVENGNALPVAVTATGADGRFAFDKLLPGEYRLDVALPEDILYFEGGEPAPFALGMGETVSFDRPVYVAGSLEGIVWEDLNNDGLYTDDEPGLEEIRVMLLRADGVPVKETVTDAKGVYRFEALAPQTYVLRFTLPEGYLFTAQTEGGSVAPASDVQDADTDAFDLEMGVARSGMDAGALRYTRVGDLVWLDANGNGLQDTGEPGIEGVAVRLWTIVDDEEVFVGETRTDASGRYRFDRIRPGTYYVAFVLENSLWPTQPMEALGQINSKLPWQVQATYVTAPFLAQSGRFRLDMDAGFVPAEKAEALGWVMDAAGVISLGEP